MPFVFKNSANVLIDAEANKFMFFFLWAQISKIVNRVVHFQYSVVARS